MRRGESSPPTLKQARLKPPERNPRRQQDWFDRFQHEYNHERPPRVFAYEWLGLRALDEGCYEVYTDR
jgi:hypothetical protein